MKLYSFSLPPGRSFTTLSGMLLNAMRSLGTTRVTCASQETDGMGSTGGGGAGLYGEGGGASVHTWRRQSGGGEKSFRYRIFYFPITKLSPIPTRASRTARTATADGRHRGESTNLANVSRHMTTNRESPCPRRKSTISAYKPHRQQKRRFDACCTALYSTVLYSHSLASAAGGYMENREYQIPGIQPCGQARPSRGSIAVRPAPRTASRPSPWPLPLPSCSRIGRTRPSVGKASHRNGPRRMGTAK